MGLKFLPLLITNSLVLSFAMSKKPFPTCALSGSGKFVESNGSLGGGHIKRLLKKRQSLIFNDASTTRFIPFHQRGPKTDWRWVFRAES